MKNFFSLLATFLIKSTLVTKFPAFLSARAFLVLRRTVRRCLFMPQLSIRAESRNKGRQICPARPECQRGCESRAKTKLEKARLIPWRYVLIGVHIFVGKFNLKQEDLDLRVHIWFGRNEWFQNVFFKSLFDLHEKTKYGWYWTTQGYSKIDSSCHELYNHTYYT